MTGERILVVDDGDDVRHTITQYILKPNAYDYLEAKDGLEALAILRTQPVDLILLDLQMPRMDGLEVLRRLRDEGISIPVVLMTMYGSEEIAIEVFRLGARDYIIKPFAEDELLGALERALSETRLRREHDHLTEQLMAVNESLTRQINELQMLYETGRQIVAAPDAATLIALLLETVMRLIAPLEASLLLCLNKQSLTCVARAHPDRGVELVSEPVADALADEVMRSNEPRLGGAQYDEALEAFTVPLAVPLNVGETLGALIITTLAEPLNEHQVTLLSALAVYAAMGLERLRLLGG